MEQFLRWVRGMYPDFNADECMQRLEYLVKRDCIEVEDDTEYLPTCQQLWGKETNLRDYQKEHLQDPWKPKFKPGDSCRVKENILEWIKSKGWAQDMEQLVREIVTLDDPLKMQCPKAWNVKEFWYYIPEDCLELAE
ncbi:MAG: hypothetical protein P8X74_03820 [Reinekea sp.]